MLFQSVASHPLKPHPGPTVPEKWLLTGTPEWLRQLSVPLLVSAQVMISRFVGSSPTLGSVPTVQGLLGILSLSLSL